MKETDDSASDSLRSSVSSPGMPNTYLTPSASKHSTNTSEARRSLMRHLPAIATLVRIASGSTYQRPPGQPAGGSGGRRLLGAWALIATLALVAGALTLLLGGPAVEGATTPPAGATLLLAGAGDGHGVGLSQDGTLGYA